MSDASQLPTPLQYLPAFELAARHLSFKRAAEQLHVTASAVSQQIRALEEALELTLFKRMTRSLQLTAAGEQFALVASETLDCYRRGTQRVLRLQARPMLRLSCDAYIAHELLIPELHTFHERHPNLELRIETSSALADFDRDGVDAAVRYGRAPWPGLHAHALCEIHASPVCAAGFVRGDRVRTPRELAKYPLISMRDRPDPWSTWADRIGVALPPERLVFDSYFATLRAAEKGLGIAVGLFPISTAAVREGRLVTPLSVQVRARAKQYFVCRKPEAALTHFVALREWAHERFAALAALPDSCQMMDEP